MLWNDDVCYGCKGGGGDVAPMETAMRAAHRGGESVRTTEPPKLTINSNKGKVTVASVPIETFGREDTRQINLAI